MFIYHLSVWYERKSSTNRNVLLHDGIAALVYMVKNVKKAVVMYSFGCKEYCYSFGS